MKNTKIVKRLLASSLVAALMISQMGSVSFAGENQFEHVRRSTFSMTRNVASSEEALGLESEGVMLLAEDGENPEETPVVEEKPVVEDTPVVEDAPVVEDTPVVVNEIGDEDIEEEWNGEVPAVYSNSKSNYVIYFYNVESMDKINEDVSPAKTEKLTDKDYSEVETLVAAEKSAIGQEFSKNGYTVEYAVTQYNEKEKIDGKDYKKCIAILSYEPIMYQVTVNYVCNDDPENIVVLKTETVYAAYGSEYTVTDKNDIDVSGENGDKKYGFVKSDSITVKDSGNVVTVYYSQYITITLIVQNINYNNQTGIKNVVVKKQDNVIFSEVLKRADLVDDHGNSKINTTWYDASKCGWKNVTNETVCNEETTYIWEGTLNWRPYTVQGIEEHCNFYTSQDGTFVIEANQPTCTVKVTEQTENNLTIQYENNNRKAIISGMTQDQRLSIVNVDVTFKPWYKTQYVTVACGTLNFDMGAPKIENITEVKDPDNTELWLAERTYIVTVSEPDNESGVGSVSVKLKNKNGEVKDITAQPVDGKACQFSFTVGEEGTCEVVAYDKVGNVSKVEAVSVSNIATEPASSKMYLPGGSSESEVINGETWYSTNKVRVKLFRSEQTNSQITCVKYELDNKTNTVDYSEEDGYFDIALPSDGVHTIKIMVNDRAGTYYEKTYTVKCDVTAPIISSASIDNSSNDILNKNAGNASLNGNMGRFIIDIWRPVTSVPKKNKIILTIEMKDETSLLDHLTVSGFALPENKNKLYVIDLNNDKSDKLDNSSDQLYTVKKNGKNVTVTISLNASDLQLDPKAIDLIAYDHAGNYHKYIWENGSIIVMDGVNPTGSTTITKEGSLISNANKLDENTYILAGNICLNYLVKDKYLYETVELSDDGVEGDVTYKFTVSYRVDMDETAFDPQNPTKPYDRNNVEVEIENKKGEPEGEGDDILLTWNASLTTSDSLNMKDSDDTISLKNDGLYTFRMHVEDPSSNTCEFDGKIRPEGNNEAGYTDSVVSFYYDTTAPVIETSKDVENGWTKTGLTISGTASDKKWGEVTEVYYTRTTSENFTAPATEAAAKSAGYEHPNYVGANEEAAHSKSFTLSLNEKNEFNGYYHFWTYDTAGNCSSVSSVQVQIDSTAPTAELDVKTDVIYNDDVEVAIVAKETNEKGMNSGLKQIAYEIYCDGKVTSTGVIEGLSEDSYSGKIKVPSKDNEGDAIYVVIKVMDQAGNEDEFKSEAFAIDITNPEIEVSYDNNDVSNDIYFHNKRVATVVIKEHNFDASKVKFDTTGVVGTFTTAGDIHTATVVFDQDGEHTIAVTCTDLATNESDDTTFVGAAPEKFTVDLTSPKVTITYNNNNASNGNYYKDARVATITVIEKNFDAASASNGVTVSNVTGGSAPALSGWTNSGDVHTATVSFTNDAEYTIEVSFEDLATNKSEVVDPERFVLDQELPVVNVSGVANNTAYNAPEIAPVITVSDENYDVNGVVITLTGAVEGNTVTLKPTSSADLGYAHRYEFANIEADGLYTMTVQVSDLAGNMTDAYISEDGETYNGSIQFSVNRNGSVYTLGQATQELINKVYANEETEIVITETNVNILTDIQIVITKDNNQTTLTDLSDLTGEVLKEGEGYSVTRNEVNGGWSQYTYTIDRNNFMEDGVYHIALFTVDAAGNKADTDLSEAIEMTFVIDKTAPIYIVSDLSAHTTYNTDNKEVTFSAKDNMALESVVVLLNGEEIAAWTEEEIREMQTNNEDFCFVIPESVKEQTVTVTCVDKAGNMNENPTIEKILVTTNGWVRFTHNKTLVAGTGVAASTVFAGGVSGFGFRRRRRLLKKVVQNSISE